MKENIRQIAGINSINQALDRKIPFQRIYVDKQKKNPRIIALLERAKQQGIVIEKRDKLQLDLMLAGGKHQGVIAEIVIEGDKQPSLDTILQRQNPLILLLDGLEDPHNLGACLRSAAAANVDAVVLPKNRSAGINATVSKVASGGAEMLPIFIETNLSRVLEKCQRAGLWSVALTGHADKTLYETELCQGLVVMMGNEGRGLSQNLLHRADYRVKIPMLGDIESLNVSVATGIVLFEALRQRSCINT